MSEIYTDAAGNKYLGDCRWGNHDINYPTTDFLITGSTVESLSADLGSLISDSTLQLGTVLSQPTIDSWGGQTYTLASFSTAGDLITNRFHFSRIYFRTDSGGGGGTVSLCSSRLDDGSTIGANITTTVYRRLFYYAVNYNSTLTIGCASSKGMALVIGRSSGITPSQDSTFWYAGELLDANTNFNYYTAGMVNKSIVLHRYIGRLAEISSSHYIAGAQKSLLQTGRAAYTISCSDGQTPGSQWATDMWVYDNNATLGYPVIGRVPNMLLGIGSYTYLKPVKIQGSIFPDNGSPWYLPVGTFAGKTLLMRCYSSMA